MPVAVEPVVVVVRLKGDSQGLLNTLDDLRRGQTAAGPTPGLIIHTVSPTDDGVLIVDVWESETHYWAFLAGSKERRGSTHHELPGPEIQIHRVQSMLHPAGGWPGSERG